MGARGGHHHTARCARGVLASSRSTRASNRRSRGGDRVTVGSRRSAWVRLRPSAVSPRLKSRLLRARWWRGRGRGRARVKPPARSTWAAGVPRVAPIRLCGRTVQAECLCVFCGCWFLLLLVPTGVIVSAGCVGRFDLSDGVNASECVCVCVCVPARQCASSIGMHTKVALTQSRRAFMNPTIMMTKLYS